jgi:hypothetical protein
MVDDAARELAARLWHRVLGDEAFLAVNAGD